jgi:hypothetical protein
MAFRDTDTFRFRAFRDIEGRIHAIDLYKRNGKVVPNLGFFWKPSEDKPRPQKRSRVRRFPADLFANLTELEKHTWEKIVAGRSVGNIAAEERVTRSAIYERIRGNSKGHGGMVAKNCWVAKWWELKKQQRNNGSHN